MRHNELKVLKWKYNLLFLDRLILWRVVFIICGIIGGNFPFLRSSVMLEFLRYRYSRFLDSSNGVWQVLWRWFRSGLRCLLRNWFLCFS